MLLLMLSLAWGRAASAAPCADALLGRAAALEAGLLSLRDLPGAALLRERLERQVELFERAPRAAESGLAQVEKRLARLREFAASAGAAWLATYAPLPEFLRPGVRYRNAFGRAISFEEDVLEEMLEQPALATQTVRALDRESITQLRGAPWVIEVRLHSRQFGDYRVFGVAEGDVLVIKRLVKHHTRAHDIMGVLKALR